MLRENLLLHDFLTLFNNITVTPHRPNELKLHSYNGTR
jgi:hypothetical protein